MSGSEDAAHSNRAHHPYTQRNPIPTISKYRQEQEDRRARAAETNSHDDGADGSPLDQSRTDRLKESVRGYWRSDDEEGKQEQQHGGAGTYDRDRGQHGGAGTYDQDGGQHGGAGSYDRDDGQHGDDNDTKKDHEHEANVAADTSEASPMAVDPKEQRKRQKKNKDERAERTVTDPITHLPVKIFDFTAESLEQVDENEPAVGTTVRTATGLSNRRKSKKDLDNEQQDIQDGHDSISALFPPPSFDELRRELVSVNTLGLTVGLCGASAIILLALGAERFLRTERAARLIGIHDHHGLLFGSVLWLVLGLLSAASIWELIAGVRTWIRNRMEDVWEENVWEANRDAREQEARAHETESVSWLNSLVGSVWPLINPDLFTSLADTLEDVMQASLPKLVQMVSVEDLGQGSESLRILGVRWLPTGAAGRAVGADGKLQSEEESEKKEDGDVSKEDEVNPKDRGEDEKDGADEKGQGDDGAQKKEIQDGMEAEEGDFINLEVAFAYRARASKSLSDRTKDIHLYLAFYLPGAIKIPVYVDVRGLIGTCRMRLQLTPDPPFFSLCTITFLGQPKVDISCIPLVKRGLNLMDLPLISNFVQSSVNAAMAEYVAPRSLTLDLKDMLVGDDFKKDTTAKGVLVVEIRRGYDFKAGDASIPLIKNESSSDPYVSVAWAKFGKPMFSTRVLVNEMKPAWVERCYLLVTPEELDVDERVRLQLWDSDRFTADDDLGRIELDLKKIMKSDETNNKMHDRTDGFKALKAGTEMPGKLEWSIGYFSKTRLQNCQFQQQTYDKEIRSMRDLEHKATQSCESKLREAQIKKGRHSRDADELEQQRKQELKSMEDAIVICAPPPDDYPSGIFSIQIHNITGLSLEALSKSDVDKKANHDDEEESGESLPSAYCNITINHKKIFKTRTKPKNGKPFYNAGTERFIPDWKNCEVFVSVRDARVDEDDPLVGIVHLPLGEVFKERAQVNRTYPISGGIGYGRIRISMVWRSIQLQAPPKLLGWECGTLELKSPISGKGVPDELHGLKMKVHSNLSAVKLHPSSASDDEAGGPTWSPRKQGKKSIYLPFQKRYSSPLTLRWKKSAALGLGSDTTVAFSVLWLRHIPDDEEMTLTLPVWKGDYDRASKNCMDLDDVGEGKAGEKVGDVEVKVKFWPGLGGRHRKWAEKDADLKNVVEVLECARDEEERRVAEGKRGVLADGVGDDDGEVEGGRGLAGGVEDETDEEGSSSSSSDDDSSDDDDGKPDSVAATAEGHEDKKSLKEDGRQKTDLIDTVKDYTKDRRSKHRTNRGVMQYKAPRTAKWALGKVEGLEEKVKGVFGRHTREPGVETEV
ncbi:unnamed protein product [Zymoseptoria tritici ST99CH_1E4]|uniref:C2 domain-containing protein n=1 Tax=Zymoseptoria tritici ST99CH_1E4 TaxID=1276532 RepID=A0A2H1GN66_ZYMTR|nr:unnamed protein product [Zymoseptoria tritici ST99CH_1E4]